MLNLSLLHKDPQIIITFILKKEHTFDIQKLSELNILVRELLYIKHLCYQKNELAQQTKGGVTPQIRQKSIKISIQIKYQERKFVSLEKVFNNLYSRCPNIS